MHLRTRLLYPLLLLCCFGCIDIPEVEGPPDSGGFSLSISGSTQASVVQGDSYTFQVSLTRTDGFNDSVSLGLEHPPAGISAQPVTIPAGGTSASLTVTVDASVEPGTRLLTVRATSGSLFQETTVDLRVVRPGEPLVKWTSPSQGLVYVKDSVQLQVAVEGGADSVELLNGTTVLARLSGPSYQYTWDTTHEPEGDYPLTARATFGNATFTSPVLTVAVDRTAPTVQTRTPETGASNVSARQTLQVRFSEALHASSVTDASVVVSAGSTSIAKTLSLSTDGKTLTLTPTAPLPVSNTITITLGTATAPVTDLAGNRVATSTAWAFSVPAWLPLGGPLSAVSGNTSAENVAMKVGVDGNPVVAWAEPDSGGVKNIYARRWNGTEWEALGSELSGVNGSTSADMPALAITPESQLYLVWQESNGTNTNIYGKKWSGTWEALPAFAALSDAALRDSPAITLAGSNSSVVASSYFDGANSNLEVFWLNPTSNLWAIQMNLEQPSNVHNVGDVQIATGKSVRIAAYDVYSDTQSIRGIAVQKSSYSSPSLLGGGVVTSPAKRTATHPSLALDGVDNPYIAWQECPDNSSQSGCGIYAALWNGSWQMLGTSVSSSSTDSTAPSLVLGTDGHPIVAWSGFSSTERSIWVSRWTGSAWQALGAPLSAASGSSTAGFNPVLALDKNGRALVAWQESDGSVSNIYVYRYND